MYLPGICEIYTEVCSICIAMFIWLFTAPIISHYLAKLYIQNPATTQNHLQNQTLTVELLILLWD